MLLLYYKNSFLASAVSLFGCAFLGGTIYGAIYGEIDITIALFMGAFGLAMMCWGKYISNKKKFRKWWKQVEDAKLDEAMKHDANLAITIYNKNPCKRTLKKITEINPSAAKRIELQIQKK